MKENIEQLAKEVAEKSEYRGIVGIHTGFVLGYNKCLESHLFTADDMIEFYNWMQNYQDLSCALRINEVGSTKELLQLWQEQKTKTVWYE